jgi:hypothetical protein
MINIKMELKELILLQKTIYHFFTENKPLKYGGKISNYPKITDEEYNRLVELFHKLCKINEFKI